MVQVGFSVPTHAQDAQPSTPVEFARHVEQGGGHSAWAMDRLVFGNQEPLIALGAMAAVTSRIRLGTCVLLATLRPPLLLAKAIASLDQMTGGRMTIGIGVGSRQDDFAAAEVPWEHRGGRAEELVEIMRLAWSGAPVEFAGKHYNVDVGSVGPTPIQSHLPIWFGGGAETALKRIARIGDGYIGGSSGGPEGFRTNWEKIVRYAEAIGRDPGTLTPAALIYACVDDDVDRATATAKANLMHYYGPRRSDTAGFLLGRADDCVRMAHEYAEAGVQTMIIGSVTADVSYLDRFLEKVLPRLPVG
jgi:probable F420-dependent oxidoreductase